MRVSVIVPCRNGARYLPACLDSVLAQTMTDWELLLVDDGSTDETPRIASAYAARDARVRVLTQPPRGVSAARNAALAQAAGEWVTFVDGDDLLPPHALATLLSAAKPEVDMVVGAHETFDEQDAREIVYPQTRWMDKRGDAQRRAVALRLIEGDSVLNIMCNKLHRRALLVEAQIRLLDGLRVAEDALFNLEATLCGRGVAYVPRVTYRYRTHAASAMHRETGGAWVMHEPWLRAMQAMLLRRGVMEAYYPAFVDSAVLRLYKDGGVPGVLRDFREKAQPLLAMPQLDARRMTPGARALWALCRSGRYPYIYPLLYPVQVARRKLGEAAAALRAPKERPR